MSVRDARMDCGEVSDPSDEDESRVIREYRNGNNPYWHPIKVDVIGEGDFFVSQRTSSLIVLESVYHPHTQLVHDLVEEGLILFDGLTDTQTRFRDLDELKDAIAKGEIVLR